MTQPDDHLLRTCMPCERVRPALALSPGAPGRATACSRGSGACRVPAGSLSCAGSSLCAPPALFGCLVTRDMRGTAATSDGGKETVRARSYWCDGLILRGGWLRERGRAGYGRIGFRVGGSDHRDWLSAHSAVRRATISFFYCIFERGRDIPQHA